MSCLITMSQKELHRLEFIQRIRDGRLSVVQAAEQLGLSRSQVHRLLQAYDQDGTAGLVSKKRSQPSNRRQSEEFRTGQTDHMFGIRDGSTANGYQKRGRKPGRRTDFMNDPEVIARRQQALARMEAVE